MATEGRTKNGRCYSRSHRGFDEYVAVGKPKMSNLNSSYRIKVDYPGSRSESPIELRAGRQFRLDQDHLALRLGTALSNRMVDLLRIAVVVHVDSIVPRDRRTELFGWSRQPRVSIEVFDHDFWKDEAICELLSRCINFLSGDSWEFQFLPDRSTRMRYRDDWFRANDPPIICLYSGGLDSAAGLAGRLRDRPRRTSHPGLGKASIGSEKVDRAATEGRMRPVWNIDQAIDCGRSEGPSRQREYTSIAAPFSSLQWAVSLPG